MLVHDAGATVKSGVEEHKGVETRHRDAAGFEVFEVQRIDLLLKFFGNNDHMSIANAELVENQSVAVCHLVNQLPVLKRFYKGIFTFLVVFIYKGTKRFFIGTWLLSQNFEELHVEVDVLVGN